jgi:hypothetical protein
MKTFWIVSLIAFLVFIIIYTVRSRHTPGGEYRARFFSRMPRARQPDASRQDSIFMAPVIFGPATDGGPAPASAPDCGPGGADTGGGCSAGGDGGGASY